MSAANLPRPVTFLLALSLTAPASPARAAGKDAETKLALRTAAALYEGVQTHTLPNGLRVYLKPIPGSPAVTTMVAYKVGSADEDLDHTGLAHYLEHLMFKGTAKLRPGDIDRLTFRQGGSNNAYTTTDLTAYHFTFPAGKWLPALQVEADRMRNLRIDAAHEFDKEKKAVINELIGNEDQPWDLEGKAILPMLFGKKTPYGHPVIGESRHVLDAKASVIKGFYDRWYHPNNASLILVGGFDPDEALAAIKKLFGPIPRAKLPPRKPVPKLDSERPARLEMKSKFRVPRMILGYNTVQSGHPDSYALNVLEALLGGGKRSRLYRALVEGAELASSAGADHTAGRYPGWFGVQVEMLPGKDRARAEKLVLAEIARLRGKPVAGAELRRVKHQALAGYVFGRESPQGVADALALAVTVNDLDYAKGYLPKIMEVTPADVQRVAKKYLDPDRRVTLWSLPEAKPRSVGSRQKAGGSPLGSRLRTAYRRLPTEGKEPFSLKKARRVVLDNGLVLLLFENHRLPVVEAHAAVQDAALYAPDDKLGVATLTGYLLDEGTKKHSGAEIAEMIEGVGGVLSVGGSGGSVRVLAPDRKLGLGLLLECLSQPSFPREAFARNKARLLAEVEEAETQPETRALRVFLKEVYGKHPLGRPSQGTPGTVRGLTRADCADFHSRVFVPNNTTLAVVGDFDAKEVVEEVRRLTAEWKKAELKRPKLPEVEKPREFRQKVLKMPEAAQLHFYMGHVGVRRSNPDYYKLMVMDYILGTGPGFTDRLSGRLRDREGLGYTVTANITSAAGVEPGTFTCYIGTEKQYFARVKKEFLEEIRRIRDDPPAAREVADAKAYLLGSRALRFATNGGIADQLLAVERYKLGFDYPEDFRKAVAAVTPEDVRAVARKYLDPDRMVVVAAGPVDAKGQPLKGEGPKK
jgi:zinc protease